MNLNGNILDTTGREIYSFGGPNCYMATKARGYIVILEWLVGAQSTEPMMVLQAERRGPNAGAFAICLSSIGAYADPSGGAAPGAMTRCMEALDGLGRNVNSLEANTLLDVILRFVPDLINMPPAPKVVRNLELAPGRQVMDVQVKHEASGRVLNETVL